MKISNSSKKFLKVLNKKKSNNKCIKVATNYSKTILTHFYTQINYYNMGFNLLTISKEYGNKFFLPKTYSNYSFPSTILDNIKSIYKKTISYSFNINSRHFKVHFFISNNYKYDSLLDEYIKLVYNWLSYLSFHIKNSCTNSLVLYFYLIDTPKTTTSTEKNELLSTTDVNSGYTIRCQKNGEIVVFRKEEWFKVFIHETIHQFGLEFSHLNSYEFNKRLEKIYGITLDYAVYESYCEVWARIINSIYISLYCFHSKTINSFITHFNYIINNEIKYSLVQLNKILKKKNLTFNHLINPLYKKDYNEDTKVFSYYIISGILLFHYNDFLSWCNKNNTKHIIEFKSTITNEKEFGNFIEKCTKDHTLFLCINDYWKFIYSNATRRNIKNNNKTKRIHPYKINKTFCKSLRMSLYDLF